MATAAKDKSAEVIDLNRWHHAVHQVSGAMALKFNRATPADLAHWALALQTIAAEMAERAGAEGQDQTSGDEAA